MKRPNTRRRLAILTALLPALTTESRAQQAAIGGELPVVAPTGSLIAFLSNRVGADEVFVIGADGSDERQVTHGGAGRPWWSADGKEILFAGEGADSGRVFAITLEGAARRVVASVPGRNPVLSPEGTRVAFLIGPWTATQTAIANVDGSDVRAIAGGRATAWNGVWSPDGTHIAYTYGDSTRVLQVHLIASDGSGDHPVTHMTSEEGSAQMPAWSSDGRQLAIQVSTRETGHIWVVDLATGEGHRLAEHAARYLDEVPAWFPDGRRLAFQSNRTGRMEVWVMNADGSGQRQVTGVPR